MKTLPYNLDPDRTTIAQVRDFLKKNARKGSICPCCRQWVQIVPKDLTPGMGFVLMLIHRASEARPTVPVHVPTLLKQAETLGAVFRPAGWQTLTYWGLISVKTHPKDRRAGHYVATDLGHAFARKEVKVRRSLLVYQGKRLGLDVESPEVGIEGVLGTEYVYEDLKIGRIGVLP